MESSPSKTPILLLKTASTPTDAYAELFASSDFSPTFVPVLLHRFEPSGLSRIRSLLDSNGISARQGSPFGGLIFTSQRAVEAFAKVVEEGRRENGDNWPQMQDVPVYSVGPATTRALKAVPTAQPLQIFGEHTGNGDALAKYMLDHYNDWYKGKRVPGDSSPPLLFLVGEQRRDIIPKTLTDPTLPTDRRIPVTEEVVYGTGVMESFPMDFDRVLHRTRKAHERWVVVFSPTGCDGMLRGINLLNENTGRVSGAQRDGQTFVVTIGPTTQSYLRDKFDFEPDASAEMPSPEGVLKAILDFRPRQNR